MVEVKIKAHASITSQVWPDKGHHWRSPDGPVRAQDGGPGHLFRSCSYCGCIHPDDLIEALEHKGAKMHQSDWKYGWPHKFYVKDISHEFEDMDCVRGSSSRPDGKGGIIEEKIMGKVGKDWAKWYNEHLEDLDEDRFNRLTKLLKDHTGIEFSKDEKGIKYRGFPG